MFHVHLKWSASFFLKNNKSFKWHLRDYEKHNFFPFEGLWEEKLWFLCVFMDDTLHMRLRCAQNIAFCACCSDHVIRVKTRTIRVRYNLLCPLNAPDPGCLCPPPPLPKTEPAKPPENSYLFLAMYGWPIYFAHFWMGFLKNWRFLSSKLPVHVNKCLGQIKFPVLLQAHACNLINFIRPFAHI